MSSYSIPANFFWDISVRFLSWECCDFWRRHDHFRRLPKNSEVFRKNPKSFEDVRSLPKTSDVCRRRSYRENAYPQGPTLVDNISAIVRSQWFSPSKIRDREEDGKKSHFSIRREKLARKREPAWDRSFQPAGVRLTPKEWELAGIT